MEDNLRQSAVVGKVGMLLRTELNGIRGALTAAADLLAGHRTIEVPEVHLRRPPLIEHAENV